LEFNIFSTLAGRGFKCQGVKLTTYINLVPRLRESGATPLLSIRLPGLHRDTKTITKIVFKTHNIEDRTMTWFLCLPHHTLQFLLFPKKGTMWKRNCRREMKVKKRRQWKTKERKL
jgi:hypothetical protein